MQSLVTMAQKELRRLEAVQKIRDRRLSVVNAAKILGISRSQVHRLLLNFAQHGAQGLVSKKRGVPSNRRHSEDFRNAALDLVREHYADFGPTLACEKLTERHGIGVSKETLRQWMVEAGIWKSRRERRARVHQPRGRRDCFGELVQIDGSHHWWFENRGPRCALLVFIDDATGRLVHLRFAGSENTFDYLTATKCYLLEWGKPLAFYSDKHGVFRATHPSEADGTSGLTQFGRALNELNIDIICANTPQAKGRVERANQTLQDRLVKELRLRDISSIEAANAFVPEFIADFNDRFGKEARNPKDMHRPLAEHENLDDAMCHKEYRTLSRSLTLRYDKVLFILDPTSEAKGAAGKRVIVYDFPDGRLEIRHEHTSLPYRTFDKLRSVNRAGLVENKRLDAALMLIADMQSERELKRSQHAPRRTGQSDHMFGVPEDAQRNAHPLTGRKRGRRADFVDDPTINALRAVALARLQAAE